MLGSDDDVFHSRIFCDSYPVSGIELCGIELWCELLIFDSRDVGPFHEPLADSGGALSFIFTRRDCIESPMNKHSKARLAPPLHAFITLRLCFSVIASGFAGVQWL